MTARRPRSAAWRPVLRRRRRRFGLDRLKLVYSVVYALDGVPMIYMGDEIAWPTTPIRGGDGARSALAAPPRHGLGRRPGRRNAVDATRRDVRPSSDAQRDTPGLTGDGLRRAGNALARRDGRYWRSRGRSNGGGSSASPTCRTKPRCAALKPATDLFDGLRLAGATAIPPWQALWLHEV